MALATADFQYGQIDVYMYTPKKIKYLYSFNNGLRQRTWSRVLRSLAKVARITEFPLRYRSEERKDESVPPFRSIFIDSPTVSRNYRPHRLDDPERPHPAEAIDRTQRARRSGTLR